MDLKKLFKDTENLDHALTHKSWVNENPNVRTSNERLEFLGDAVLEFVVSKEIFNRFPDKEEGYLTALRSNLVNTINLASVAEKLKIKSMIYLSVGEEDGGGRDNPSILANTMEAIIGALFMDGGADAVEKFIADHILVDIEEKVSQPLKDPKSRLQELVQAKGHPAPRYEVVEENGPDHDKNFTINVLVDDQTVGMGIGKNKSQAAQNAAEDALNNL